MSRDIFIYKIYVIYIYICVYIYMYICYIYNIVFRNTKHIIPYYYTISFQGGRGRQRREKRKGKERETERELWDDHSVGSRMSHAAIIVAVALATEWAQG